MRALSNHASEYVLLFINYFKQNSCLSQRLLAYLEWKPLDNNCQWKLEKLRQEPEL